MTALTRLEPLLHESWIGMNLAPAPWVHASHWPQVLPPEMKVLLDEDTPELLRRAAWCQANACVLSHFELTPLEDADDPCLMAALLPLPAWDRWILHCGLLALGPQARRVIAGQDVQALRAQWGDEGLQFARRQGQAEAAKSESQLASEVEAGDEVTAALMPEEAQAQATQLGQAIVNSASAQASEPVASRLRLRLPVEAGVGAIYLSPLWTESARAWRKARAVLQEIDPSWCSLFPAPH